MLCAPAASVEIVSAATPLAFNVPLPMPIDPSSNCTVPVGAGPPVQDTEAVKVTAVPTATVALLVDSIEMVAACEMTSLTTFEVPGALVESPAYFTDRLWVPALKVVVEKVATPLAFRALLPIRIVPS